MSEKTSKENNSSSHQEAGLGASSSKNSKSRTNMFGASNWNETLKDMPKPDLQKIMKSHRKNVETVKQAQEMASELFQSLSTLNNQYMRQSFEELDKQAHTLSGSFKNFDKPG